MPKTYSVAFTHALDELLRSHLVRDDGQEDLTFGLWSPSHGRKRETALLHTALIPQAGEREIHGNVSFNPSFFERTCREALALGAGIAFMHSHPFPGWQAMSNDDVMAEERMAGAVLSLTGLPLLGLTVGSNGVWSARIWAHVRGREYARQWCESVRVVGDGLRPFFANVVCSMPRFRETFRRTISVWGAQAHSDLARLCIGIVGLGSVGALVAEALARMGLTRFALLDFDRVEPHNLDRLVTATEADIGRLKVDVAKDRILAIATCQHVDVVTSSFSIVEKEGYRTALDCDVLFSCVDRPRARSVLDHLAFAHLIPVIDGGIQARFKQSVFTGVDWQAHSVMPGTACLECIGAYDPGDVSTEAAGKLDDPSYLAGLPQDHRFRRNENVFPFAANLASMEVLHLVAMVTRAAGVGDFGVQRFRYVPGIMEQTIGRTCRATCDRQTLAASGDTHFSLIGFDAIAVASRQSRRSRRARLRQRSGITQVAEQ